MKTSLWTIFVLLFGITCFPGNILAVSNQTLKFKKHVVIDKIGFGYEAFRLLIPEGWRFNGGISWNYNKIPPEALTAFTVKSPDGNSVMEQFPHINLFWSQDQNLQFSYSQAGLEILQPMGAIEFLKNFFIPRFRANASGLKIIQTQDLPELAQQNKNLTEFQMNIFSRISPFQFPFQILAEAGRLKMEYLKEGKKIIEDVTVSITYMVTNIPNMYGGSVQSITWIPIPSSFKAPANEIDEKIKIFKIITDSRKDNPLWIENGVKLAATVTREQLRHQNAIFNRMQQISKTQSEMGDMIMDSYQKRQQAYDRIFDNYSQAIRGVDSYHDPINDWKIELPMGYDNAWTNGSDYILSDDAGFNPNMDSTQNWEQMKRQQ